MNHWLDYHKQLESSLIKFDYLYSGDPLSATTKTMSFESELPRISTIAVTTLMHSIYEASLRDMIGRIKEKDVKVYDKVSLDVALKFISKYKYAFANQGFFNLYSHIYNFPSSNIDSLYRECMYKKFSVGGLDFYNIDEFLTNEELNSDQDYIFYVVDKPIQSLIYTMNTTTYDIIGKDHTIRYKYFNCDFTVKKVIIRDKSIDRENKLGRLLE